MKEKEIIIIQMTKSSINDNYTANFKSANKRSQQSKPAKTSASAKAKDNQTLLPFATRSTME